MNKPDIDKLLQSGEKLDLECKRAERSIPKSLWETYSAFANTKGGLILLGVEEKTDASNTGDHFSVQGVFDPEQLKKDFWNTVNSDKVFASILNEDDVQIVEYDENVKLLLIRVPQAEYRQKPVYINGNVYKGTFKRNYKEDYHCSEDEIKAMIRDSLDDGNDGILIKYYTMDDIDAVSLKNYRNEFENRNLDHAYNQLSDKDFLRQLGGLTTDCETGTDNLTMAGLLMFGKGLSVRERFSNFRMDYLDMTNLIGDMRYSDRLTYDGTWENNLYNFFRRVLPKLTSDLKRPFRLEGMQRNDDTPARKAVREALTNSIIHADFLLSSGVLRIEKHDDGFCFRNPGSLKLPVATIYEGGLSRARNPKMQNMFRMIGFGENIGSGFPTILDSCRQEHWEKPVLSDDTILNEVSLTLKFPVAEENVQENEKSSVKNNDVTANDMVNVTVSGMVIKIIQENPDINVMEIAKIIQKSERQARRIIADLKKAGILRHIGSDKSGYWEVVEK